MRVHDMALFDANAAPFASGRSSQARDFANTAMRTVLPWLKEHYDAETLNQATFTPGALLNLHLRGDFYLGLTGASANAQLVNMDISAPGANPRLVNIARPAPAYANSATSVAVVDSIANMPTFPPALSDEYGLRGGTADIATPAGAHFFTRDIANGSILTEFVFAEQASLAYRLLPYMENFHAGIRDFIVAESIDFLQNAQLLCNTANNNTQAVHQSVRLDDSLLVALDAVILPGVNVAALGVVSFTDYNGGNAVRRNNYDFGTAPIANFAQLVGPAVFGPPPLIILPPDGLGIQLNCVLPIYLALAAYQEYDALIRPDIDPVFQDQLDDVFTELLLESVRTSLRLNASFGRQAMTGILRSNPNNFNANQVRDRMRDFLNVYFRNLTARFPVGTIVELNLNNIGRNPQALNAVVTHANPVGGRVAGDVRTHIIANPYFEIVAAGTRQQNRRTINIYQLRSVDANGIPLALMAEEVITRDAAGLALYIDEEYSDGNSRVPAFTLHSGDGTNNPAAHTPMSIVGRLLLSASYSIFNTGAYYSAQRDMRKLRKEDSAGHYPPLIEAHNPIHGRGFAGIAAHVRGHKFGIIDAYAESRADLVATYLAAMYDSLTGKYRDQFVAFYTGDIHTNEVSYYTNAVSNYIDSQTAPEDVNRDPVLVGPRLTTRVPVGSAVLPGGHASMDFTFTRSADPEVVYYQIDSPLLREVLQQLHTRFYTWYVGIAEDLDRGRRNLTLGAGEVEPPAIMLDRDPRPPAADRTRVAPTKLILQQMWPLINQRAIAAVESGEVPPHIMMQTLAAAVTVHRGNTSQAVPLVPISNSFINFGELLRSPGQYALPPSLSASDVEGFLSFIEATYYNDYNLIATVAASIETDRTRLLSQDQLISAFKKHFATYRNTKVLNRFTFPASANLIHVFRDLIGIPAAHRAAIAAITTTTPPPAPLEQLAAAPPVPEPVRRLPR